MPASRVSLIAAFAALYVIWGSTYLAIRFAIETLPPFLMAGGRFVFAGGVMYAWARLRGAQRPTTGHWRSAAIIGTVLFAGGNGMVVWAEQFTLPGPPPSSSPRFPCGSSPSTGPDPTAPCPSPWMNPPNPTAAGNVRPVD